MKLITAKEIHNATFETHKRFRQEMYDALEVDALLERVETTLQLNQDLLMLRDYSGVLRAIL